jgi:hypothetical protein
MNDAARRSAVPARPASAFDGAWALAFSRYDAARRVAVLAGSCTST